MRPPYILTDNPPLYPGPYNSKAKARARAKAKVKAKAKGKRVRREGKEIRVRVKGIRQGNVRIGDWMIGMIMCTVMVITDVPKRTCTRPK